MRIALSAVMMAAAIGIPAADADIRTAAEREALFEDIVEKTMEREAFSPIKNKLYGLKFPEAFEPLRAEFRNASTEEELYYAIVKLSNARKDRHLSVTPVEGGLTVEERPLQVAPIRFMADFGQAQASLFVADLSDRLAAISGGDRVKVGDRLVSINGEPVGQYIERTRPYHRASSEPGFLIRLAMGLNEKSMLLPEKFYGETLDIVLKPKRGRNYTLSLPYLNPEDVKFAEAGRPTYPGFEKVLDFDSFDFYRSTNGAPIVIFDWYGFRNDIVDAMDKTIEYADREGLLSHNVIWDGSWARGGGRGAYAIQRLQPKPFKTTFGNLRISDITQAFIDERKQWYDERKAMSDGALETVDDGAWLMDWLLDDVAKGLAAGQAYTNDVPFKLAHAPKYSDGVLYPADKHFTGEMVCWMSPRGGSHLDQFAAIVYENELCTVIGMPAGGFSNTWEWDETLTWSSDGAPIANFMWNIGHTITPSGRVLEGKATDIHETYPITADTYETYYDTLLERTLEIFNQ